MKHRCRYPEIFHRNRSKKVIFRAHHAIAGSPSTKCLKFSTSWKGEKRNQAARFPPAFRIHESNLHNSLTLAVDGSRTRACGSTKSLKTRRVAKRSEKRRFFKAWVSIKRSEFDEIGFTQARMKKHVARTSYVKLYYSFLWPSERCNFQLILILNEKYDGRIIKASPAARANKATPPPW